MATTTEVAETKVQKTTPKIKAFMAEISEALIVWYTITRPVIGRPVDLPPTRYEFHYLVDAELTEKLIFCLHFFKLHTVELWNTLCEEMEHPRDNLHDFTALKGNTRGYFKPGKDGKHILTFSVSGDVYREMRAEGFIPVELEAIVWKK